MLPLNGMSSVSNLLLLLSSLAVMSAHMTNSGISLYAPGTAVRFSLEDVVGPKATWTSVGRFHVLCRTTFEDVVAKARTYYDRVLCRAKRTASALVRRSTVFVADAPETTWTASAGPLHVMRRTTVGDVVVKARTYYDRVSCCVKRMAPALVRRLMNFVADTLEGKVIYGRLLPRISGLYCNGRATFESLKFIHDVEIIVM